MIFALKAYPHLDRLVNAQVGVWPAHADYLARSMTTRAANVLNASERAAGLVVKLAEQSDGGLSGLCEDYRFVCQTMILDEELHFRRFKAYRLKTFEEAYEQYYSNSQLMQRYMNGLLLSGIFWINHANALAYYLESFLQNNVEGYAHLEVGPGHGLLTYFAAIDPRAGSVTGWDVSEGSIVSTRHALQTIGVDGRVELVCQDVFDARGAEPRFDSVVVNEVLEHLEDPLRAMKSLKGWMRPHGRIWINMPVNSPAPDHLYLLRAPEEMLELMTEAGLAIEQHRLFPMTGVTLERARRHALTINIAAVGRLHD